MRRRWGLDPRLRYLPEHPEPYEPAELYGAWRAFAERALYLSPAALLAVDVEEIRALAWTVTRREGAYSLAETRRILDRLEGDLRARSPRWIVATAGLPAVRLDPAGGLANRADVLAQLAKGDAMHLAWREERIAELRSEGATWAEIAVRLGAPESSIRPSAHRKALHQPKNERKATVCRMDSDAA